MTTEVPATALLSRPSVGRVFTLASKVRLGDVDPNGRLRLDATARHLQDAATDDAADARLDRRFGWLVRRTKIVTTQAAVIGEQIEVSTWCTGIGRAWAERRTQIVGNRGGIVDAVSLWVQVDIATGRPARVGDDFRDPYGDASGGRAVSARLSIAPPEAAGRSATWEPRRTDIDPFDHVNNAATWSFVEEFVDLGDRRGTAELEHLAPLEHGNAFDVVIRAGDATTVALVDRAGATVSVARWTPA